MIKLGRDKLGRQVVATATTLDRLIETDTYTWTFMIEQTGEVLIAGSFRTTRDQLKQKLLNRWEEYSRLERR